MSKEVKTEVEKKEEVKIVGTVKIFLHNNNGISVEGPVNNPVLMMQIFGKAMESVAAYITSEAADQDNT